MLTHERQVGKMGGSPSTLPAVRHWISGACDLLFPPTCSLCAGRIEVESGASQQTSLCVDCVEDLTARTVPSCLRCARPLPDSAHGAPDNCPACRDKTLHFDFAHAIGVYDAQLRTAVLRMKQSSGELLTLAMGRLLAARLATRLPETPDYLASVPPHWSRRLSRAISCPEILREMLCRQLGLRSAAGLLKCRRKTKKQGTLLPAERRRNVRGAYAVSAGYAIKGASILVVDDVMTTGATANEIAKVLRRAGAKRVTIAAVARGIGFDG